MAHIAFSNNAAFFRVFWNIVWALENAVGAADALIIEVADNAGIRVLFISSNRAAIHASRVFAVVASRGDGLLKCRGGIAT